MRIISPSPRTTQFLAKALAEELFLHPPSFPHATVIALGGPLGAGKTVFVKGFARALGIRRRLPSPSFILIRRYPLRHRRYRNLFHVDAYRLRTANRRTLAAVGLPEALLRPENLFLIEWADRLHRALPRPYLAIRFATPRRAARTTRILTFRAVSRPIAP